MFVALLSAKGSGVTTAAAVLAASSPGPCLMVEMDPAGGDLEVMTGRFGRPPLASIVAGLDNGISRLEDLVVEVPVGVRALLAPAGGAEAEATLTRAAGRLGSELGKNELVIGDLGRWSSKQRCADRVNGASLVVVVCMSSAASVLHARWAVEELYTMSDLVDRRVPVAVLVIGDKHYRVDEVQGSFSVPVIGPLPVDRSAAEMLMSRGPSWRWRWSTLGRVAPRVFNDMLSLTSREVGLATA